MSARHCGLLKAARCILEAGDEDYVCCALARMCTITQDERMAMGAVVSSSIVGMYYKGEGFCTSKEYHTLRGCERTALRIRWIDEVLMAKMAALPE
jgi:hypothetical protein